PANLDYVWSKNGTVLGNLSGVGRNSISLLDSIFSKPVVIKVEIVRGEEELLADTSIILTPTSPTLAVYENNPLYGFMFHREVGEGYTLEGKEVTFTAFPFFAPSTKRQAPNLSYKWSANNNAAEAGGSVTYRAPEEGGGRASIRLDFNNDKVIMLNLIKNFLIKFGNEN
ncbi:MAG: hypothetical protein AAB780_02380, partial [Patescibacteria group bacterium]